MLHKIIIPLRMTGIIPTRIIRTNSAFVLLLKKATKRGKKRSLAVGVVTPLLMRSLAEMPMVVGTSEVKLTLNHVFPGKKCSRDVV